ncbi:uncharacterized protein TNCV_4310641 [Trichonephila clavipes]|nr:uncharacterized protein TNCV_4310641 [Trichonephila clavipes]
MFGKICAKCKKKNHFAAKCFQSTKNIHEMNVPENELVYINSVNENGTKCAMKNSTDSNFKNVEMVSWYKNVSLDVNNKCFNVNFKLDTEAEINILPLYILNMFKVNPKLSKTNISLTTYGNFNLKPSGSLIINCSTDKLKKAPLPFYIVNVKSKSILGLRSCKELKLMERIDAIECSVSKNELIKQYKDIFTGVGEFPNEPYHITLKDNAVPVCNSPTKTCSSGFAAKIKKFGVPNIVVSDNIPFNSYIYKEFANDWDFNYAFISSHYSPSNGMVEKTVGISKSIMKKAREDRRDYFVDLMEYINTPISGLGLSPAQMMFNRRLKTKLPISNKLLIVELFNNIREKLIKRQNVQKIHYDKTAHPLPELEPEDNVRILNFKNKKLGNRLK